MAPPVLQGLKVPVSNPPLTIRSDGGGGTGVPVGVAVGTFVRVGVDVAVAEGTVVRVGVGVGVSVGGTDVGVGVAVGDTDVGVTVGGNDVRVGVVVGGTAVDVGVGTATPATCTSSTYQPVASTETSQARR